MSFVGRGAAIGLGVESTYGTAVSRTNWLSLLPGSYISKSMARRQRETLYAAGRVQEGFFLESETVRGSLLFEATYENFGLLLKHAFGAVATTGGGPYAHTNTLADVGSLSLTGELVRGNATNSEIYEGLQVSRMALSGRYGRIVQLKVDVVGQTSQTPASAGTPSLGSGQSPIHATQAGQVGFNSNNFDAVDFELVLNNNLVYPRRVMGSDQSKQAKGRFAEATLRLTREYDSETQYNEFVSGTQGDLTWTFTGSGNNSAVLTLQNAYAFGESPRRLANDGPLTQQITYRADNDGTDLGLKLVVNNDNSTATAN